MSTKYFCFPRFSNRVSVFAAISIVFLLGGLCQKVARVDAQTIQQEIQSADQNRLSSFALEIPAANTEVFAINRIQAHLEDLLTNRALDRVLTEGAIGGFARQNGLDLSTNQALEWLDANGSFIPETIVVSASDEVYPFVVDMFEMILRFGIAENTGSSDDLADEEELAHLKSEIIEIVKRTRLPDITFWVTWPKQETTRMLFDAVRSQVNMVSRMTALEFENDDNSFRLLGTVADVVDAEVIEIYASALGIEDPNNELASSIVGLKIFFQVEHAGRGMRVSIGNDIRNSPRATAKDFPGIVDGDNQIAFATWSGKRLRKAAATLQASLDFWSKTELGKAYIENDSEDIWGSMQTLSDQLALGGKKGQLRVWSETNQVHANIQKTGMAKSKSLTGTKILRMIPADPESYALSSRRSFADFSVSWLDYFEEKMATQSFKHELNKNSRQTGAIDALSNGYYQHFTGMRTVVRGRLVNIAALPFGVVMDTRGDLKSLRIGDVPGLIEIPLDLKSDKLLRFAAISETDDPEALQESMKEMYRQFVVGVFSSANVAVPADLELFVPIDLGSDVTGQEMSLDWVKQGDFFELEIEGDFQPHVFVHDGLVVFSTSSRLSRELLQLSWKKTISKPDSGGVVIEQGRFRGVTFGNLYRILFSLVGQALNSESTTGTRFNTLSDGAAELSAIVNHCDWTTTQNEDVQETDYVLDFKKE